MARGESPVSDCGAAEPETNIVAMSIRRHVERAWRRIAATVAMSVVRVWSKRPTANSKYVVCKRSSCIGAVAEIHSAATPMIEGVAAPVSASTDDATLDATSATVG